MLLTKLLYYLRGYVTITVSGSYPERFLNVCANRHILIWDVFPCGTGVLKCSISLRGFHMLPPIARKTGVQIKIIKKNGLPMLFKRLKNRKWFVLGLLLCIIGLIIINQFIWKLEIVGCQKVSTDYVREKLEDYGLKIGAFRPYIDEKKLQNHMLIEVPELAWLWVDKKGSKVIVQVKERVMPPDLYDADALWDLVAAKDGVIDSMIIKNGNPMVKLGDTVRKGDVLVSGLLLSEKGVEPRTVQSDGEIYARVWYEKTKAFSLWNPIRNETGKTETKTTIHLFGQNIALFRSPNTSFDQFEEQNAKKELCLFGRYLGIGYSYTKFTELSTQYEKLSTESTVEKGVLELLSEIVFYKPLTKQEIASIVGLMVADLQKRLADKQLSLQLTPKAIEQVIEAGYDPVYGARPLRRFLQSKVETLLAHTMIERDLQPGSTIVIDYQDGRFVVQ